MGEQQIDLVVCRGCDLSGVLYVFPRGWGCELCENAEPLTADLMRDLASRIPTPPMRTGSNPFKNIAEDYELPYDVVVCYAERLRRLARQDHNPYPWGDAAVIRAIRIMNDRCGRRFGEFHSTMLGAVDRRTTDVVQRCN